MSYIMNFVPRKFDLQWTVKFYHPIMKGESVTSVLVLFKIHSSTEFQRDFDSPGHIIR